jgi:hypothetical protein
MACIKEEFDIDVGYYEEVKSAKRDSSSLRGRRTAAEEAAYSKAS